MDKTEAKRLNDEVRAVLGPVLERHGLRLASQRATFSANDIRFTIVGEAAAQDGNPYPKQAADWNRYAAGYGMKAEWLNTTIRHRGVEYAIAGLEVSRRKYPVLLAPVGAGKAILITPAEVRRVKGIPFDPILDGGW